MENLRRQSTATLQALIRHHADGWHHAATDEQIDFHRDMIAKINAILNQRR